MSHHLGKLGDPPGFSLPMARIESHVRIETNNWQGNGLTTIFMGMNKTHFSQRRWTPKPSWSSIREEEGHEDHWGLGTRLLC